jgi:hypothetical protein
LHNQRCAGNAENRAFKESRRDNYYKNEKILFVALLVSYGYVHAQTSQSDWKKLMIETQSQIKAVLSDYCPVDITVDSFKIALINGQRTLPESAETRLAELVKPLSNYGNEVIKRHNLVLDADDVESDVFYYSGVSPDNPVDNNVPILAGYEIAGREASGSVGGTLDCVAHALGVDAIAMFSQSSASSWTWPAIKKAFKSIAKRLLGPIGVAIAVIDFGLCMADIV